MSIGVWSILPIFLSIHLHGSLQCHAQLTYIHSHLLNSMSILTIIFQTQVHLHADLVYLFISITGIVATPIPIHSTTSLVNKLETPIYTWKHKFGYKYIQAYAVNWEEWLSP